MAELITKDGRLVLRDGRLADASCLTECCDGLNAVKFVECCDGDPVLWVLESLVAGCVSIKVGEFCYRNTGEVQAIADLEHAGLSVLRAFTPNTGDGCVSDCRDERCRDCPTACCVRAYLPACRSDQPRRCCLLGSAYRLEYTRTVSYRLWGYDCASDLRPGGGCFSRIGQEPPCYGYQTDPLEEWVETINATMIHTGEDAFGSSCSGVQPSGNRFIRRTGRRWTVERYTSDAEPVNGRYEPIDERTQDNRQHFARGEMPSVIYGQTEERDAQGNPIGEACNFSGHFRSCARAESEIDPCPSPTNPLVRIDDVQISGSWDCAGGVQTVVEQGERRSCGETSHPLSQFYRRETVTTWTVTILSRQGCEVETCADADPMPGGGLLAGGSGGCAGCRGGPGL